MDMDMGMGMDNMTGPLTDAGMNMSNITVAYDFLQDILNMAPFQAMDEAVAEAFWYGIIIVITIGALVNFTQYLTLKARLRAAAANKVRPASPRNFFTKGVATITAFVREVSYPQFTPARNYFVRIPPVGVVLLLLTYLCYIIGLEYYHNFVPGAQHFQAFGLRATLLSAAQLPLLVLLASKNNIIGYLVGSSYERLQIFHRWVARTLFLTATLHGGYQLYGWNQYGLVSLERETDTCWPTGFAAWSILLWMNVSTIAPIRNWNYEIFVVQHLITFFGFIIAVMEHMPVLYCRVYVYIPIGIFLLDRIIRGIKYLIFPGRATITAYGETVTKIRIRGSRLKWWKPGQYVLVSLPGVRFGQSHPATIVSTPSSHNGEIVLIMRCQKGFSNKLLDHADAGDYLTFIDGPYGGSQSDFAAFDSTILIAGSTGVTFTLPILLDLAHRAATTKLPLRTLTFIWVVKTSVCKTWVSEELRGALRTLYNVGIETNCMVFVTCDPEMTDEKKGCTCTSSPCCCTQTVQVGRSSDDEFDKTDKIEEVADSRSSEKGEKENTDKTIIKESQEMITLRGRPDFKDLIWKVLEEATGETGIGACGPLGMTANVRRVVAEASDARAVHKGTGAEGIYLHVETFGW